MRLKGYDYTSESAYFVTIRTKDKKEIFGQVINEKVFLNEPGKLIESWWKKIEQKYSEAVLDKYIIMPNHFHGIIMLIRDFYVGADPCVRPDKSSLSDIIKWFKTMTTNEYIRNVKDKNWIPFNKQLWQRSFYDRIIRNEKELENIRAYIMNNPIRWEWEKNNPENICE